MQELELPEQEFSLKNYFIPFTAIKAVHILVIIGLLLFVFSLFNNFVGDDNTQIIDNPEIQSLQNLPVFYFENRLTSGGQARLGGEYYKPFLDTSYAATYALFGPEPFAYHFIQLILFITNACLVFLFLKNFFTIRFSFILSLLFLIHPINSEAALYIADTQDVLFFFFGMCSLLIITKFQDHKALIAASFLILLSCLSKETGILFIPTVLLYAFLFKKKSFYSLLGYLFISVFAYSLLRIHALGLFPNPMITAPIDRLNFGEKMINIPSMFLYYLKTFFYPVALSGSWQWAYTHIDFATFILPFILDLLFLVVICGFAGILQRKNSKKLFTYYIFFLYWFLIGVFFHMQFFPLDQTVADRWFYFPIFGLLGMLGVLLTFYKVNLQHKWISLAVILLFSLLSLRTFIRSFDFRNDFILATHDEQVSKDSYNAEYIISYTYYEEGDLKQAKIHAERSIQLFPYITNYTNLGAIESRLGDYKDAKNAYIKAMQYGDDALPYENLASLSFVYGSIPQNVGFIKNTALKKFPQDGVLWYDLAILEYINGNKTDAKDAIDKANLYGEGANAGFIEQIINSGKSLRIQVQNGNVTFLTQK
jgi:tetratricopeptide (TPR) repeat protein